MEIKIGVLNVPTQIVIDSDETTADIKAKVADALAQGSILELTDR